MRITFPFFLLFSIVHFLSTSQEIWTLEQCLEQAITKNLAIQKSQLQLSNSALDLKQSKLNFGPNINASADYANSFGRSVNPFTYEFINARNQSNSYGINTNIDLFNGLARLNELKRDKLKVKSEELAQQIIKDEIQLNLLNIYLSIISIEEQVVQQKLLMEETKARMESSKQLVDVGRIPESNLVDIEVQQSNEGFRLNQLENELANNYAQLKIIMNVEPTKNIKVKTPDIPEFNLLRDNLPSIESIYNNVMNVKPEFKRDELLVEQALINEKVVKGNYAPRLSLSQQSFTGFSSLNSLIPSFEQFNVDLSAIGIDRIVPFTIPSNEAPEELTYFNQLNRNLGHNISLNLSVPIFNKGVNRIADQRSRLSTELSRLNLKTTATEIYNTVVLTHTRAATAQSNYKSAIQNLASATKSYEFNLLKKEVGRITDFEMNVASTNLATAKSRFIQSKYEYLFSLKTLDILQGLPLNLN